MDMIKPQMLRRGSRVAAVSLSWGGPGTFRYRYEAGKQQLEEEFGVTVIETEHALRNPDWLSKNPKARADDLMAAFADDTVDGIFSTIGGEDSIRILPYLDLHTIRDNPKVFMGYSDTTISHTACFKARLVSFYGPALMTGFAENGGMFPYMIDSVRKTLFSADPIGLIKPNQTGWTAEHLDWSGPANQPKKRKLNPPTDWVFHQDHGEVKGMLFGGCVEVLDWLRGSPYWPPVESLRGAVLFLETSEDAPPPSRLTEFIRSLAAMGVLERLGGILFGRPGGQIPPEMFQSYDAALCNTIRVEYGLGELPIVTNMDFGHTDPVFVFPVGLQVRINSAQRHISIDESAVVNL